MILSRLAILQTHHQIIYHHVRNRRTGLHQVHLQANLVRFSSTETYLPPPSPENLLSNTTGNRTIARSFSEQLNDAFLIDDSLDKLASTVEQKYFAPPPPSPMFHTATPERRSLTFVNRKQSVTFQSSELKLLEESIRRAEALLEEKKNRLSQQFPGSVPPSSTSPNSRKARPPIPTYDSNGNENSASGTEELPARAAPMPPSADGFVVVQKTPSMLSSTEGKRFDEQYKGRPRPPVPTES